MDDATLLRLHAVGQPLGRGFDARPFLDLVGDASIVLIGEATHGSDEFYRLRAWLTERLIEERGFEAVAIEGDWPDALVAHRWARGEGAADDPASALAGFARFPQWMWRNSAVVQFLAWLRAHNHGHRRPVAFYGLDLYGLHAASVEVLRYLERVDPDAAARARRRYGCFETFGPDLTVYAREVGLSSKPGCAEAASAQLVDLLHQRVAAATEEEYFEALESARLVVDAEAYYREMFGGWVSSWNRRDRHMADVLDGIVAHLERHGGAGRVVVWAHNSHVGDGRATEATASGEVTLGQLARERHGDAVRLVGMTTFQGTVAAAGDWEEPVEHKRVRPALDGSWEELLHRLCPTLGPQLFLPLHHLGRDEARLERAIGVVYLPERERAAHWFHAVLRHQFDAVFHLDQTHAVAPLETTPAWTPTAEPEETSPTGF